MENQVVEKKRFFTVSSEKSTFAWLSAILFFFIIALEACIIYGPFVKLGGDHDTRSLFEWTEFFQSESGKSVSALIYLIHGGILVMIYSMLKKCMSTDLQPMKNIWIGLIVSTCVLYAYYAFFPYMEISDYNTLKNVGLAMSVVNSLAGIFLVIICWTFIRNYSGRIKASGVTILVSSVLVIPVAYLGSAFVISFQGNRFNFLLVFWIFLGIHILFNFLIYMMLVRTMVGSKDYVQPYAAPVQNPVWNNGQPMPPAQGYAPQNQPYAAPVQPPVANGQPMPPAQGVLNNTDQPEKNNKKLFIIIGGAVIAVALVVIIWLVAGKSNNDVIEDYTVSSEYESVQDEVDEVEDVFAEETTMEGEYFVVTGSNVLIREGPGKEYAKVIYMGAGEDGYSPAHAQKGEVVKCLQGEENNYIRVKTINGYGWEEGWVCCDYLKATTVCPECHGVGQDPSYGEFDVDGPRCKTCKGKGHL